MATIKDPQLARFLDLIAFSEGTSRASKSRTAEITRNDGYDAIVCGVKGPGIFTDYADHPFADGLAPVMVVEPGPRFPNGLESTASGRYQILLHFFEVYKVTLDLPDFGPMSQDLVALQMIRECDAQHLVEAGQIGPAITACSSRWASFPGNTNGQGGRSMSELLLEWSAL
jgi:muramidase (phage lysozyme)